MFEQENKALPPLQYPATNDINTWNDYWKKKGQPWRTEPVEWRDEKQRERKGLDLRGADLCKVNLSGLPLACTIWGLIWRRRSNETEEQREIAGAHLEGTDFRETSLEGSSFRRFAKRIL